MKKNTYFAISACGGQSNGPQRCSSPHPTICECMAKGTVQMRLRVWTLKVGDYLGRPNLITSF